MVSSVDKITSPATKRKESNQQRKWWWSDGEEFASEVMSCFNSLMYVSVSCVFSCLYFCSKCISSVVVFLQTMNAFLIPARDPVTAYDIYRLQDSSAVVHNTWLSIFAVTFFGGHQKLSLFAALLDYRLALASWPKTVKTGHFPQASRMSEVYKLYPDRMCHGHCTRATVQHGQYAHCEFVS